jgi:hypothetical protein
MKIFISYRRNTWPFARQLASGLRLRLLSRVFVDVDSIDEDDFERCIMRHLSQSNVFVLVASDLVFDPAYIHRSDAWVRREIAEALRLGIPIVMARIDGLTLPPADDLPEDIREITKKQGEPFYPEYFSRGITRLARLIRRTHNHHQREAKDTDIRRKKTDRFWQNIRPYLSAAVVVTVLTVILVIVSLTGNGLVTNGNEMITSTATNTGEPESTPTTAPADTPTPINTPITFDPALTAEDCQSAGLPIAACIGVTHNADWTPYTEEINGVEMALVPAGCFMMGSESGYIDEQPIHEVCFEEPFWIDVYEVTNAQFGLIEHPPSVRCSASSSELNQPSVCVVVLQKVGDNRSGQVWKAILSCFSASRQDQHTHRKVGFLAAR